MVSKNQIKLITALQQKKFRAANGLFLAEGIKVIRELIDSDYALEHLYETDDVFPDIRSPKSRISTSDLKKISALSTPNNCLAVFKIPAPIPIIDDGLILVLDDVRDPGNFGTIIRLCDWFGISQIVCSEETVDLYNPKVVQATMGSLARVNVSYRQLENYLQKTELPVFGTFMDGENIYTQKLPENGVVVFGNEANGISAQIEKLIKNRLAIPRFGKLQQAESLNVSTAAAIVLSEFRKQLIIDN